MGILDTRETDLALWCLPAGPQAELLFTLEEMTAVSSPRSSLK